MVAFSDMTSLDTILIKSGWDSIKGCQISWNFDEWKLFLPKIFLEWVILFMMICAQCIFHTTNYVGYVRRRYYPLQQSWLIVKNFNSPTIYFHWLVVLFVNLVNSKKFLQSFLLWTGPCEGGRWCMSHRIIQPQLKYFEWSSAASHGNIASKETVKRLKSEWQRLHTN